MVSEEQERGTDSTRTLSDVMARDVEVVGPNESLTEVAARMRELGVGFLPVCEGDRILGTVTDRDLVVRGMAEGLDLSAAVEQVMTAKVEWLFEDHGLDEAAELMREKQIRRTLVVDRDNNLVGVVALGDLATRGGNDALMGKALEGISQP